jgi:hypothetical protein
MHGDSLLLQARITNAAMGEVLRAVGPVVAGTSDPAAAEALAQQVIGALSTLLDSRLATWAGTASQPPNLQAYRVYATGLFAPSLRHLSVTADGKHLVFAAGPAVYHEVWAMENVLPQLVPER